MTIIEPNSSKLRVNVGLLFVIGVVCAGALFGIFLYNDTVHLRHVIQATEERAEALRAANADERSELYALLEGGRLQTAGAELGLIEDRNPKYIEIPRADLAIGI